MPPGLEGAWSPTDRCRYMPASGGATSPARRRSRCWRGSFSRGRTCVHASPNCRPSSRCRSCPRPASRRRPLLFARRAPCPSRRPRRPRLRRHRPRWHRLRRHRPRWHRPRRHRPRQHRRRAPPPPAPPPTIAPAARRRVAVGRRRRGVPARPRGRARPCHHDQPRDRHARRHPRRRRLRGHARALHHHDHHDRSGAPPPPRPSSEPSSGEPRSRAALIGCSASMRSIRYRWWYRLLLFRGEQHPLSLVVARAARPRRGPRVRGGGPPAARRARHALRDPAGEPRATPSARPPSRRPWP